MKLKAIIPVSQNMNTISGEGIRILGAVLLRVAGTDKSGRLVEAAIMAYVTESTTLFYLAKQAMRQPLAQIFLLSKPPKLKKLRVLLQVADALSTPNLLHAPKSCHLLLLQRTLI